MSRKQALIRGTAVLTVTSLSTRFMGFFYRMFLSHTFGEENVGLYQLVFPVYALGISLSWQEWNSPCPDALPGKQRPAECRKHGNC